MIIFITSNINSSSTTSTDNSNNNKNNNQTARGFLKFGTQTMNGYQFLLLKIIQWLGWFRGSLCLEKRRLPVIKAPFARLCGGLRTMPPAGHFRATSSSACDGTGALELHAVWIMAGRWLTHGCTIIGIVAASGLNQGWIRVESWLDDS